MSRNTQEENWKEPKQNTEDLIQDGCFFRMMEGGGTLQNGELEQWLQPAQGGTVGQKVGLPTRWRQDTYVAPMGIATKAKQRDRISFHSFVNKALYGVSYGLK